MSTKIILNIVELKVALPYGQASVSVQPAQELKYEVELPEEGWNGESITIAGVQHIVKNLAVTLVTPKDEF